MTEKECINLLDKAEKDNSGDSATVHATFDQIIYEFLLDRGHKLLADRYRHPRHTFYYGYLQI